MTILEVKKEILAILKNPISDTELTDLSLLVLGGYKEGYVEALKIEISGKRNA